MPDMSGGLCGPVSNRAPPVYPQFPHGVHRQVADEEHDLPGVSETYRQMMGNSVGCTRYETETVKVKWGLPVLLCSHDYAI